MWLINTTNLQLERFQECPAYTYVILSHTWSTDSEELDFDEFKDGKGREKTGFEKIRLCCEEARRNDIRYAWVDTCCIDKRSSAELSEAINSMFAWYTKSKICYVYLSDVSCSPADRLGPGERAKAFRKSRWFTRGWTLQELIAPTNLTFYTKEWISIGDKVNLAKDVHYVTRIDINVLIMKKSFLDCSIAQRMSWASLRHTTRIEDSAYCLLGLFDVNFPLMYGEGSKAFLRLQKQIIGQTDDETIFAWSGVPAEGSGLLAPSAKYFVKSGTIGRELPETNYHERTHYFNTNRGLSFECQLIPYALNTYLVPLNCCRRKKQIAIFLTRTTKDDQYRRTPYEGLSVTYAMTSNSAVSRICRIYIPENGRGLQLAPYKGTPLLHIESKFQTWHFPSHGELPAPRMTFSIWIQRADLFRGVTIGCKRRYRGQVESGFIHYLQFGFDQEFRPVCALYDHRNSLLLPPAWDTCDLQQLEPNARTSVPILAKATANDHESATLVLPLNSCSHIEVSVRHAELNFLLTISERRRHERRPVGIDVCFRCLADKFVNPIIPHSGGRSSLYFIVVTILGIVLHLVLPLSADNALGGDLQLCVVAFLTTPLLWYFWKFDHRIPSDGFSELTGLDEF